MYDYDGRDAHGFDVENALKIRKNEKLTEDLSGEAHDGWIVVKDTSNQSGKVPISYLKEVFFS